jgi:hypothetical protein
MSINIDSHDGLTNLPSAAVRKQVRKTLDVIPAAFWLSDSDAEHAIPARDAINLWDGKGYDTYINRVPFHSEGWDTFLFANEPDRVKEMSLFDTSTYPYQVKFDLKSLHNLNSFSANYVSGDWNLVTGGHKKLKTISVESSNIGRLDLTDCKSLTSLNCRYSSFDTPLDISTNTNLTSLNINYVANPPALTHNTKLQALSSVGVAFPTTPDLRYCTQLRNINFAFAEIDISNANDQLLDLRFNTKLESIVAYNSSVHHLNVSGLTHLTNIDLPSGIQTVNASDCTALGSFYAYDSNISSVNLSGCTALTSLSVNYSGNLEKLDVSGLTALVDLEGVYTTSLEEFNSTGCTALENLTLVDNVLSSIDLSTNQNLVNLSLVQMSNLTSLDVSMLPNLVSLNCSNDSSLDTLNFVGCNNLLVLNVNGTALTSLDVSMLPKLNELSYSSSGLGQLTSANLVGCNNLSILDFTNSALTSLDFTGLSKLESITLRSSASIESLDLSDVSQLYDLDIANMNLSSLNVAGCTRLNEIDASGITITSMDLTPCTALTVLDISGTGGIGSVDASGLQYLQTVNCAYGGAHHLNLSGCVGLTSINTYCTNGIQTLNVSDCSSLYALNCSNMGSGLTAIDLTGCTGLLELSLNTCNNLTAINTADLVSLTTFSLTYTGNLVQDLDLTMCVNLQQMNASYCGANSIDVSNLTNLSAFAAVNSAFYNVYVTGCTALTTLNLALSNIISSSNIDAILNDMYANALEGELTNGYINLTTLNGGIHRTSASDAAVVYLSDELGWAIFTD